MRHGHFKGNLRLLIFPSTFFFHFKNFMYKALWSGIFFLSKTSFIQRWVDFWSVHIFKILWFMKETIPKKEIYTFFLNILFFGGKSKGIFLQMGKLQNTTEMSRAVATSFYSKPSTTVSKHYKFCGWQISLLFFIKFSCFVKICLSNWRYDVDPIIFRFTSKK